MNIDESPMIIVRRVARLSKMVKGHEMNIRTQD